MSYDIDDKILADAAAGGLADPECLDEDDDGQAGGLAVVVEREEEREDGPADRDRGPRKILGSIGQDGQISFGPTTKQDFGIYEAIRAAEAELLTDGDDCPSFVGNLDIWGITEEDVLKHMPPDAAYAIERAARIGNRDLPLFIASWEGMLSMAVGMRFMAVPSAMIHRPGSADEAAEIESFKINRQRFGRLMQPCYLWSLIIGRKTCGKSFALEFFRQHIGEMQEQEASRFRLEMAAWREARRKTKDGQKETADVSFQELIRPYKTAFYSTSPTQAAHLGLMVHNPRGVAVFTDEASSLFSSAAMHAKGGDESFRNYLLKGYDAGSHDEHRKNDPEGNDPSNEVRFLGIPLVLGIQPARLQQLVEAGDESGVMTRLKVFWAERKDVKAEILTPEQIFSEDADMAEENQIVNNHFRERIQRMTRMLMVGENRLAITLDGQEALKPQAEHAWPRVLGLSRAALVEYRNFKNWLMVSVQSSRYGNEENDFVERDLDRAIRLAGMLHVYENLEQAEVSENGEARWNTPQEIAAIPISMRTLQRAIISVLYSARIRRENFARFRNVNDAREHAATQAFLSIIAKDEAKYSQFMSFSAIRKIPLPVELSAMKDWKDRKWGIFLKTKLKIEPERQTIDGKQQQAYRLADALHNFRAALPAPAYEEDEEDQPAAVAEPVAASNRTAGKPQGVKPRGMQPQVER